MAFVGIGAQKVHPVEVDVNILKLVPNCFSINSNPYSHSCTVVVWVFEKNVYVFCQVWLP